MPEWVWKLVLFVMEVVRLGFGLCTQCRSRYWGGKKKVLTNLISMTKIARSVSNIHNSYSKV